MSTKEEDRIRADTVTQEILVQLEKMLLRHFDEITQAGLDSFDGDPNKEEPIAKVGITVEWSADAVAPNVAVKLSWAIRYRDESEQRLDPLQGKLVGIGGEK